MKTDDKVLVLALCVAAVLVYLFLLCVPAKAQEACFDTPDNHSIHGPAPTNSAPLCDYAPEIAVRVILDRLTLKWSDGSPIIQNGEPLYVFWCRNSPFGCEQTIRYHAAIIWNEARSQGVSPWLVLAQTWHESRFNAFAESEIGTRGILQLHPRSAHGRSVRFVRDRNFRERVCRNRPGHCQRHVVRTAVALLERSLNRCGDIDAALSMYASGDCNKATRYSRTVIRLYQDFLYEAYSKR